MNSKIEMNKIELMLLKQRLAEVKAERDHVEKQLQLLKSSLTPTRPRGQWRHTTVAAVSVVAVACLLTTSVIHDAQSNVQENGQSGLSAINTLDTAHFMNAEQASSSGKKPAQSNKTRYVRAKKASQKQWGPLLVMPDPKAKKRYYGFDPLVKEQQKNLLTLGFNIGKADGFKGAGTRHAIAEFRALYLPESAKELKDADLAVIIESYANLARNDAARYGVDHGIVAAIRLSSVRTAVDFSYLMKLAATESNFKPKSQASTSSATGLYQFTHDTWLNTLKEHGAKYGQVADYAENIKFRKTRSGYLRPIVRDQKLYKHLLALRKNPRLSAMMAAETVRDSQQKLANLFDRKPTETDLYLTHFLGEDGAITFLQSLEESPGAYAKELFPHAARSNRDIFQPRKCAPRTVDEVYTHFGEKFNTRRYDDVTTDLPLSLASN